MGLRPPVQSRRIVGRVTSTGTSPELPISGLPHPRLYGGDAWELAGQTAPVLAGVWGEEDYAHAGAEVNARGVEAVHGHGIAEHTYVMRLVGQATAGIDPGGSAV